MKHGSFCSGHFVSSEIGQHTRARYSTVEEKRRWRIAHCNVRMGTACGLRVYYVSTSPVHCRLWGLRWFGSLQFNHSSRIKIVFSRPFSKHPQAADAGEPLAVHKSRGTEPMSSKLGSKALTTVLTRTADASSEESQNHAVCHVALLQAWQCMKRDVTVQPSNKKPAAQLGLLCKASGEVPGSFTSDTAGVEAADQARRDAAAGQHRAGEEAETSMVKRCKRHHKPFSWWHRRLRWQWIKHGAMLQPSCSKLPLRLRRATESEIA